MSRNTDSRTISFGEFLGGHLYLEMLEALERRDKPRSAAEIAEYNESVRILEAYKKWLQRPENQITGRGAGKIDSAAFFEKFFKQKSAEEEVHYIYTVKSGSYVVVKPKEEIEKEELDDKIKDEWTIVNAEGDKKNK